MSDEEYAYLEDDDGNRLNITPKYDQGGWLKPGRTSVAVSRETHASLVRFAAELTIAEGRQYTMDQAIARAVDIASIQVMSVIRPKANKAEVPVDNVVERLQVRGDDDEV